MIPNIMMVPPTTGSKRPPFPTAPGCVGTTPPNVTSRGDVALAVAGALSLRLSHVYLVGGFNIWLVYGLSMDNLWIIYG